MPHFTPAPLDLDDPAANVQRAVFVAVLARSERDWSYHTTGLSVFSQVLREGLTEDVDKEVQSEIGTIMLAHTQGLKQKAYEVQCAAQILSGFPLNQALSTIDLRALIENSDEFKATLWIGCSPQIKWLECVPIIECDKQHLLTIFSALTRHGIRLAQFNTFTISLQKESESSIVCVFSGDTNPKNYTDPDEWFFLNEHQRASISIGLFVAYKLAQMYGGRVWVETANKTRFDFRLILPLAQEATND